MKHSGESMQNFVVSLLTSGKYTYLRNKKDMDAILRLIVLNITYGFASVIIIGMGVSAMREGLVDEGLLQIIIGFMIALNLFLLRTELPFTVGGLIVIVIFGGFCGASVFTKDGLHGLDCLWIYSYPLMSVFTLGLPLGFMPAFALLAASALGLFLPEMTKYPYSLPEGIIICGVYAFVLCLASLYEYVRSMKDTWLIRQEKEILEARDRAEAASRAKSNFLANMSHEIRTPINAIIGMTSIAKAADDAERKEYCLDRIEEASAHLLAIINDILDMSKIEADKFELSPGEFDFASMLNRVSNVLEFRLAEKKQIFTLDSDPAVPERIIADEQRLVQVITNLLTNAVKFTPAGGKITLKIRLLSGDDEGCVLEISVSDTGIGISKEQQAKLFQSFVQGDNTISRKFGGTGLGLAISKKIVEMMGGDVSVESENGKGATFRFTMKAGIPVRAETDGKQNTDAGEEAAGALPRESSGGNAEKDGSGGEPDFSGYHILLAEDVEINREIVVSLLEPTGVRISEAENGQEAFDKFSAAADGFDLIFMDIHMPGMDGYEAARRIRASGRPNSLSIPIIAMTANVFKEDIERCFAAGMSGHIGKPIDFENVMALLKKYLTNKSARRAEHS